jgi:WD40 repeat protein
MTSFSLRIAGIIALFVVSARPSQSQPSLGPRTDQYGDALPEGAIARLGTLRLTHLGVVEAVAISPDGTVAASGVQYGKKTPSADVTEATIRLWNVKTGELLRQIATPDAPVSFLRFAADGKTIFVGCGKFLCCFECASGKKAWAQQAIVGERFNKIGVQAKEIIQAGATLMSLHSGNISCGFEEGKRESFYNHPQLVVSLWNAKTGVPLPLAKALQSTIEAQTRVPILLHEVAFTHDLKYAAIGVSEGDPLPRDQTPGRTNKWKYPNSRVEVIDLASGKVLLSIANRDGEFGKLALAPDGSRVAALTGKTIETPFKFEDGKTGFHIDERKDLWLASVDKSDKRLLAKNLTWIKNLAFVSEDHLAAIDGESKVTGWRLDTGARVEKHDVGRETFTPACAAGVAVESRNNTVRLIDIKSGKPLGAFDGHRLAPSLRFAIYAPDTLISRDGERAIYWNPRSWKPTQAVRVPYDPDDFFAKGWLHHGAFDQAICVEKGLYLHRGERGLELRDIKSGNTVRHIDGDPQPYWHYFSAAGNRLVCAEDGSYDFFDVQTGKRLAKTAGDPISEQYRLSSHGKYFAKRGMEELPAIELYDVETGKLLRRLTPNSVKAAAPNRRGEILMFQFAPDEQLVFGEIHETSDLENGISRVRISVSIWNAETGELWQDMVLHPAVEISPGAKTSNWFFVRVMAISHDRRLLALSRGAEWIPERRVESTPIEIWEVASGEKRGELTDHGPIADLAFSPDDRCLASSSHDTTILIWDLNRPLRPLERSTRLTEQELDDCWRTLFERDAAKADLAIWRLIGCPDDSLPYIQKKLRPVPIPDASRVRSLIGDLNSNDFKTRTRAEKELAKFGDLIQTQIDQALKEPGTLESRQRLESLAKTARTSSHPFASMTRIGEWRALEVVEKIGRPQAIEILRTLANGAPDGQLTIAAKAALTRAESQAKAVR